MSAESNCMCTCNVHEHLYRHEMGLQSIQFSKYKILHLSSTVSVVRAKSSNNEQVSMCSHRPDISFGKRSCREKIYISYNSRFAVGWPNSATEWRSTHLIISTHYPNFHQQGKSIVLAKHKAFYGLRN